MNKETNLDGEGDVVLQQPDGTLYYPCDCDMPVEEAIKELSSIEGNNIKLSAIFNKLNLHKECYGGIMVHLYELNRSGKIRIYPNDNADNFDLIIKYLSK